MTRNIYTVLKYKYDQLLHALRNSTKAGNAIQICAAFKSSLRVSFLKIVNMLSDSRLIILICDSELKGQFLLF